MPQSFARYNQPMQSTSDGSRPPPTHDLPNQNACPRPHSSMYDGFNFILLTPPFPAQPPCPPPKRRESPHRLRHARTLNAPHDAASAAVAAISPLDRRKAGNPLGLEPAILPRSRHQPPRRSLPKLSQPPHNQDSNPIGPLGELANDEKLHLAVPEFLKKFSPFSLTAFCTNVCPGTRPY
jgi:hypothetical protein